MLEMGQSKPWQEALYEITGERQMDNAMLEYFALLKQWLDEQNANNGVKELVSIVVSPHLPPRGQKMRELFFHSTQLLVWCPASSRNNSELVILSDRRERRRIYVFQSKRIDPSLRSG